MARKYFGTDGIRGTVGQYPITPDFILRLGWAAGRVLGHGREGARILIGKDTRISGYMFESALEAGISSAGVDVRLLGPMPTPAIAYLTHTFRAEAGIVISASHNSFEDNGIKFFGPDGRKLADALEEEMEALLDTDMEMVSADRLGKVRRIPDARGRYIEFCKSTVPGLRLNGMRIVVDCAHGASYHITPDVLEELGAEVIGLGVEPDGLNINRDCGSTHPEQLQEKVRESRADLGIALDGDADRVIMVDERGELVDGDKLLYLLALDRHQRGVLNGGVVGTLMSNLGLELALKEQGIDFQRAKVGDRYVMELLSRNDWRLGGESSGHLVCLDCTSTGDGTISALQALYALSRSDRSLRDAVAGMTVMPQTMINVRGDRSRLESNRDISKAVADVEQRLADKGRVLLRPSGTEPLVRVMVEGDDAELVAALCRELADTVAHAIS
jgi:phosphoglucosamine mutase